MTRIGSYVARVLVLVGLAGVLPAARADTALEIDNLNRIAVELETVRAYAERLALSPEEQVGQEVMFDYQELTALLALLEEQVRAHVDELYVSGLIGHRSDSAQDADDPSR